MRVYVGHGKFDKKTSKIRKLMIIKKIKLENSYRSWKTFQNFNKRRAFSKAVGPGKKNPNVYSGF